MSENLRRHYGVEHWAADQSGSRREDKLGLIGWLAFVIGFLLFLAIFTLDWWITLPFGAVVLYRGKNNLNDGDHLKGSVLLVLGGVLVTYGMVQLF